MRSVEPRRLRNWAVVGSISAAITAIVLAYPYFMTLATGRFGVRAVALGALGLVALSLLWSRRGPSPWQLAGVVRHGVGPTLAIPVLLLAAALSGDPLWMQLVPTLVYLTLADVFRASLKDGSSMIELAAKYLVPELPEFVGPYCRKVTIFWALFFVVSAGVIAVLAFLREPEAWAFFTGQLIYWLMMGVSVVEFFWRKTWFRYYPHMGPFDRLWSRLFPAENTQQGRRSEAYIRLHKPDRVVPQ